LPDNTAKKLTHAGDGPIKRLLRATGVMSLYMWLKRDRRDKLDAELDFQREWARQFSAHKGVVLECWKTYRHFDEIVRLTGLSESSTVLDIGCGISSVLHFVPGRRYGIDPLADEYAKIYDYPPGITVSKSDGEHIPFDTAWFDVVFCTNVLDHVASPETVLAEVKRVLKPGGRFVLTVEVFPESAPRDPCHPYCYTIATLRELIVRCGMKAVFEKTAPWFGLRNYVNGSRTPLNDELIMVLEKA
jgi:SAM-dependent methyltransferase